MTIPTPPQPNTGDELLRISIRHKVNDAFQYGEATGRETQSMTVINAALDLVVDQILSSVKAELGAALKDENETWYNKDLIRRGNEMERKFFLNEYPVRIRNEFRAELRNHFGIGEGNRNA